MKTLIIIIVFLIVVCGLQIANCGDEQTFFIYTDNELHPGPADLASIALVEIDGDSSLVMAYAGAIWGEHDLSGRDYCIAWGVGSSDEFDEWLEEQGYRRFRILDFEF